MKRSTHRSRKGRTQALRIPPGYWIALLAIAVVGAALITYSTLHRVNVAGITTAGDYF